MEVESNRALCNRPEELLLKVVDNGNARFGSEWKAAGVSSPYSRLYYMLSGEAEIETEQGVIFLKSGFFYIIPSGLTFSYRCEGQVHQLYFHIKLMSNGGFDILRGIGDVLSVKMEEAHLNVLETLHKSNDKTSRLVLKALIQADVFSAIQKNGVKLFITEYSDCVKKAIAYIEENLSVRITVKEIAEHIFVSCATLSHKFKEEMGTSVGKYIDGLVMQRAESMLIYSGLPISQISGDLGFCDQFYFSRRFKEMHAITPIDFRKAHRAN